MYRVLLFIGMPLIEMALLIWVGGRIGIWPTLAIVILTGMAGATLVRRQGLAVWRAAQDRLAAGSLPTREIAYGAMLLVAGAFLLTPGFLTDIVGFALLIPWVREWLRLRFGERFSRRFESSSTKTRVEVWRV